MTTNFLDTLEQWISFRKLSFQEFQTQFSDSESQIYNPASYVSRKNLKLITNPTVCKGGFFYYDNNDDFLMLRVSSSNEALQALEPTILHQHLGETPYQARSSRSRNHMLYIYPEQGVVFSAGDEDVSFIEIFNPISYDEYMEMYYKKPSYKR